MTSVDTVYSLAVLGEQHSDVNALTYALAQRINEFAEVVSGDYLDTKKLSGYVEPFHIGCYRNNLLIDLINCPITLTNLSVSLIQAVRLVWVIAAGEISDNLNNAIAASAMMGISDHVVVLNTARLDANVLEDEELLSVAVLEVNDIFTYHGIQPRHITMMSVGRIGDSFFGRSELDVLTRFLFSDIPDVRATPEYPLMHIEHCYTISGPRGSYVRIAFGPVCGGEIKVGQTLALLGFDPKPYEVRIADLEQFGKKTRAAKAGGSAAVMLHSVPKNLPKVGQVLTGQLADFALLDDFTVSITVQTSRSAVEAIGRWEGIEVYAGLAHASAFILDAQPDKRRENQASVRLRLETKLPLSAKEPILLGNGADILAWGRFVGP